MLFLARSILATEACAGTGGTEFADWIGRDAEVCKDAAWKLTLPLHGAINYRLGF